jgi:ribonuclease Z
VTGRRRPRRQPVGPRPGRAVWHLPWPGVGSVAVSDRELVVLGTASRAPTRSRNHNGYLLLWDGEGLLFDPAGDTASDAVRSGHGEPDHPASVSRISMGITVWACPRRSRGWSLDRVPHPVQACYPAQHQEVFTRLRHAVQFRDTVDLQERPVATAGTVLWAAAFHVGARRCRAPSRHRLRRASRAGS